MLHAMSDAPRRDSLTTLAARAGELATPSATAPLVEPIYQSTVYAFPDLDALEAGMAGQQDAYFYYRNATPNGTTLERALAQLENTEAAACAASGMAAISAAFLGVLAAGDHIVTDERVYGVTYALLRDELPRLGIEVSFVDALNLEAVTAAFRPKLFNVQRPAGKLLHHCRHFRVRYVHATLGREFPHWNAAFGEGRIVAANSPEHAQEQAHL